MENYDDFDEEFEDETDEEKAARDALEVVLDDVSQATVDLIVERMLQVVDIMSGHPLRSYQIPLARRIIESLIINDGATLTALMARQSGKTESICNTLAACMVMLPRLAKIFPSLLGRYKEGMWVGCFAPVDEQADNLFGRLTQRLTSETAREFLADPEINEEVDDRSKVIVLKGCGSMARKQTAHPRATIEGRTYHVVLMDESQGLDEKMVNKSIRPMLASTNGTTIMTGTPSYEKGVFYKTIQFNKRMGQQRGKRTDHYEADWKAVAKESEEYGKFVRGEMLRVGEDSDEFKLSYRLMWMLDRGMFTTSERLDELGDKSMEVVTHWTRSPVVIGIDCARKVDSTVVTAVWVDWANPDEFGYFEHRILNWLDLQGVDWETQYYRIIDFCRNYSIMAIGIDAGGVGDVVASRLRVLMPDVEIVDISSQRPEQSKRWKHLSELLDRGKVTWPAHAKTRRLKVWKRFRQQMEDLEKRFEGPYVVAEAVKEAGAHDDYPDSLALACSMTKEFVMPEVEVSNNPFG